MANDHTLELWGGHECTVNRVGDRWRDQTILSGHHDRLDDLARFASLGLAALRYPVLWERVAPDDPATPDFAWETERLAEIRRLGMRPIVGLIHHGSGPRYTSLLDPGFAPGLARHARDAAERFPWVMEWTPVNEPLTTARFSGLYGFWYPHAADEHAFWLALLNQIEAVRLAMREIRAVQPEARLVQTEDLGYVHAEGRLWAQAGFENDRRWLTWDLLCGRVDPEHPMWGRAERVGLADRLRAILDDPSPPDVIGVNHYLTSERFLDEDIERYPPHLRGGNGRIAYADTEAVRATEPKGLGFLLREAAMRYGSPVAVTECHNGCTRDEQMRWFVECWAAAAQARSEGLDVRAVTAWALLGSHDWSSLLTRADGHYEPGVYDLRAPAPRETGMAGLLRTLARGERPQDPHLDEPGWWRRPERLLPHRAVRVASSPLRSARPILITGKTGTLGQAFARGCAARGLAFVLTDRARLDITDPAAIAAAFAALRPWAVINAAGYVRVDDAEADEPACRDVNATAAVLLAEAAQLGRARYLTFSSDLVFGGDLERAYVESDPVDPRNVYGRSKAAAERGVRAAHPGALIARTAAFFSAHDSYNFAHAALSALSDGRAFRAPADLFISPTYVPDLVDAALDLLLDGEAGIVHLANGGRRSWAGFAAELAAVAGYDPDLVVPAPAAAFGWAAPRPLNVTLGSERAWIMPPLEHAVGRFVAAWPRPSTAAPAQSAVGSHLANG